MVIGRCTQFLALAILLGAASAQAGELPVSPTVRDGEAGQQNDNTISWHQLLQGPNSTLSGGISADNKSESKGLKTPFLGLSITKPLQ